jgi:hypothetical protein
LYLDPRYLLIILALDGDSTTSSVRAGVFLAADFLAADFLAVVLVVVAIYFLPLYIN